MAYQPGPSYETWNYPYYCGDYSNCRYEQQEIAPTGRAKFSRPPAPRPVSNIHYSRAPLEADTIYKRSFCGNHDEWYRSQPVNPYFNNPAVKTPMNPVDYDVQKLSYMPQSNVNNTTTYMPVNNMGQNPQGNVNNTTYMPVNNMGQNPYYYTS